MNIYSIIPTCMNGDCCSFFIDDNGNVYSAGSNSYGKIGHNSKYSTIKSFTQIKSLFDINQVSCGYCHTLCLDINGNIYSFGDNSRGQLGLQHFNKISDSHIPQKINLSNIIRITSGAYFNLCLTEDGNIYSFGDNNHGQLGHGDNQRRNTPTLLPIDNVEYIECFSYGSVCKTYNTEYYSWGYGSNGALGQGKREPCREPTLCENWPNNIKSIKCGVYHMLLLTDEGYVYSCGSNSYEQLGIPKGVYSSIDIPRKIDDLPEIQRIECGYNHSLCIDYNNNLWVFGYNSSGQLGIDQINDTNPAIKNTFISDVIDLSSGGNHTFVKTTDNKIYAFGNNGSSQLGIEKTGSIIKPKIILNNKEYIWTTKLEKSRAKSARK